MKNVRFAAQARRPVSFLLVLLAFAAAACGRKPTQIRVTPARATIYGLGKKIVARAEIVDKKGKVIEGAFPAWESARPAVATVEANSGIVRSAGSGRTVVTAKFESLSGALSLEVVDVASLTVDPNRTTLAGAKGTTIAVKAEIRDSKGRPVDLKPSWSSTNPKVATVDKEGKVTSVAEGKATVTAALGDYAGEVDIRVLFREIASFVLSPPMILAKVGEPQRIQAIARDAAGVPIEDPAVFWTSSDPRTVSCLNGVVTGRAPGSATIHAVCGTRSADVSVIVN